MPEDVRIMAVSETKTCPVEGGPLIPNVHRLNSEKTIKIHSVVVVVVGFRSFLLVLGSKRFCPAEPYFEA